MNRGGFGFHPRKEKDHEPTAGGHLFPQHVPKYVSLREHVPNHQATRLKLVQEIRPASVLVIDHVEQKPTDQLAAATCVVAIKLDRNSERVLWIGGH